MYSALRRLARAVALLALGSGALWAQGIGPGKKIISGGADNPTADRVRREIRELEKVPLDGICIHMYTRVDGQVRPYYLRVMDPVPIRFEDFAEPIADLKATHFERFKDNFLWVWIASSGVAPVDFFDEPYDVVVENWKAAARIAREGGYRGLFVDTEQYDTSWGPFAWTRVKYSGTHTQEEYAAKARERGRQVMEAVNEVYPDIHLLWFFGYAANGAARHRGMPYAFVPDFIDGMIDVAQPGCRIIDGYEQSYGYKTAARYEAARDLMKNQMRATSPDPAHFERIHQAGFGIWMDCHGLPLGWDTSDFLNNYYTPAEFTYSLHQALRYTDQYVWLWFERGSLFTGRNVPWPYLDALTAARGPDPGPPAITSPNPPADAPEPLRLSGYAGEDLAAEAGPGYRLLAELPRRWTWRPDPRDRGFAEKWYEPGYDDSKGWRLILTGIEFWETSGYKYEAAGWYRQRYDVPPLPYGKKAFLAFESPDETLWLWANGQRVEPDRVVSIAPGKPLFVDVTGLLRSNASNQISLRTHTRIEFGGVWNSVKLFAEN
ncbi:MAG: hypothetical protein ABIL09_18155 [Gemmatimonadota bacterium]